MNIMNSYINLCFHSFKSLGLKSHIFQVIHTYQTANHLQRQYSNVISTEPNQEERADEECVKQGQQ
jgi:hypothetical protein